MPCMCGDPACWSCGPAQGYCPRCYEADKPFCDCDGGMICRICNQECAVDEVAEDWEPGDPCSACVEKLRKEEEDEIRQSEKEDREYAESREGRFRHVLECIADYEPSDDSAFFTVRQMARNVLGRKG